MHFGYLQQSSSRQKCSKNVDLIRRILLMWRNSPKSPSPVETIHVYYKRHSCYRNSIDETTAHC